MKKRLAAFSLFFVVSCAWLFSCALPRKETVAITHVTVIDMTGAAPLRDQTVLIEKQRIVALRSAGSTEVPRWAKLVDGTGEFLIPGLVDMHVHLTAAGEPEGSRKFMIPLLLANGVTGVRDMGGYLESLVPLRKEIEQGKRLGPSIVYAGPYLDGSPPSFEPSLVVNDRAQAEQSVRSVSEHGVDFIKVQSMLGRDAYFAIADAARQAKIPFVGHVPDQITAAEASDAGQHGIEHLTNVLRGCSRDEAALMREQLHLPGGSETAARQQARLVRWQAAVLNSFSDVSCRALIAKFAERDVWQTPTLVLLNNDAFPTPGSQTAADPRLRYIPAKLRELWEKTRSAQMRFVGPEEAGLRAQLFAKSAYVVAEMQKHGVQLLAGTDSPAPYVFPGFGLHDELALLVEAGLTPMEALQSATSQPAKFLGTSRDSGIVAEGKYADLLLLDANPLADVHNAQKIRAVIVRGKVLDREMLDRLLDSAKSFAAN